MNTKAKTAKTASKTAKTPKAPVFASRALVIADGSIDWGQAVLVAGEGEGDEPGEYHKVPQDDPSALYGEIFTSATGEEYQKNAKVPPCGAALTGGNARFTAQDVANAIANAPVWCHVAPVSGAILLGTETTHARAFHTVKAPQDGWCYLAGFAGLVFDPMTGAPALNLKMKDPTRRREMAREADGRPLGAKMTGTFTAPIFTLRPDQSIVGGSAVLNPHGEASLTSAASNQKVLDREGKRTAKAAGTTAASAPAPFQVRETEDGVEVYHEPESGLDLQRPFAPVPFTGADARVNAATKARILNNRASVMQG